uniref:Uncharacterized protein n=2 Tax=Neisseria meningitidis TaxID=487 RepID=C6SH12_NEIME|nr:hypothetical protein predicted by Glimmer/Critica [Neisseria meningitidis alpha275]CCA45097.1 hypothetical protein NMALPHA522_1556 [Neisseria meningitidis alpha522]
MPSETPSSVSDGISNIEKKEQTWQSNGFPAI